MERMNDGVLISEVLKSLTPTNHEELSLLRFVVRHALLIRELSHKDLALMPLGPICAEQYSSGETDIHSFLSGLPEDSRKYFHGLVEAIEIYQLNGKNISPQQLSLKDHSLSELRQIRDLCLQDGLRSIY